MTITICGSLLFSQEMLEVQAQLEERGHTAYTAHTATLIAGKNTEEAEKIRQERRQGRDAIREHYELIERSEAILILNYEKHGVANYIGGNTLMEIGFAHILRKQIFLLNPIPEMSYRPEIESMSPIILNGDLSQIPLMA